MDTLCPALERPRFSTRKGFHPSPGWFIYSPELWKQSLCPEGWNQGMIHGGFSSPQGWAGHAKEFSGDGEGVNFFRVWPRLNNLCTELEPDIFSRTNLSASQGFV